MPSTALITGATEGIGRAIAFALGTAGYRVGVCARTAANVETLRRYCLYSNQLSCRRGFPGGGAGL